MTSLLTVAQDLAAHAKGYKFSTEGPDYYDCSGLVWAAAEKAGLYSGYRFTTYTVGHSTQFHRITNPTVGDIVVWSENSLHGHMGIVSGTDRFFSARDPQDGFGFNSISNFHVYPVKPFYLRPVKLGSTRDLYETHPYMYGADVERVQAIVHVKVDGYYGPDTTAGVESYQKTHGLEVDGIVGPKTRASMKI